MSNQDKLNKLIDDLPNDGEWWSRSNRDDFYKVGSELLNAGFQVVDAFNILATCYSAVASEFGS